MPRIRTQKPLQAARTSEPLNLDAIFETCAKLKQQRLEAGDDGMMDLYFPSEEARNRFLAVMLPPERLAAVGPRK